MQILAAYVMFLLVIVAVGLAIVFGAVVSLAIYEAMASMRSRAVLHNWEGARIFIDNKFRKFRRELSVPLFHAHQ